MTEMQLSVAELIQKAKQLHSSEVETVIASIIIIGRLAQRRAHHLYGGRHVDLAKAIGISPDCYFKRLRVSRIVQHYPRCLEYLRAGRVSVSSLSLLSRKITEANEEVVWAGILDKSRQEAQDFLARVTDDGQILPKSEAKTTVVLELTVAEAERLRRLVDVLSTAGKVATKEAAVALALEETLERRDPMRRAQRYAARQDKPAANPTAKDPDPQGIARPESMVTGATPAQAGAVPGQADAVAVAAPGQRTPLPAALRHQVYLRDGGVCQQRMPDGSRCGATRMLEVDHRVPVARGGTNALDNLELVCREHNTLRSHRLLGAQCADRWKEATG